MVYFTYIITFTDAGNKYTHIVQVYENVIKCISKFYSIFFFLHKYTCEKNCVVVFLLIFFFLYMSLSYANVLNCFYTSSYFEKGIENENEKQLDDDDDSLRVRIRKRKKKFNVFSNNFNMT